LYDPVGLTVLYTPTFDAKTHDDSIYRARIASRGKNVLITVILSCAKAVRTVYTVREVLQVG